MKPLLVGEAPSKNEVTETPLEGRVGKRLAALCGLTYEQYLERFDRVNLLHVRQDTTEKGFTFDHAAAGHEAHRLYVAGIVAPGRIVLLLGWRVARAFSNGFSKLPYFVEHQHGGAAFYVLPHPSGVNRYWNDPENVARASEFMRRIVKEHDVSAYVEA